MRKLLWLIIGIVLGFIAAHFVNKSPEGRQFFDRVNRGAKEIGDAIATGYREVEEGFSEAFDDVERRLASLEAKK